MIMKKLFTLVLTFAALFCSIQAWAADLEIAGIRVNTSASSVQTITGTGISGTVQYTPSTKTLYLKNATIDGGTSWALFNEIADLKIELYGTNTLTSAKDYATTYSRENIRIVSTEGQTGSLYVKNTASSLSMATMFFEENKKLYVTAARLDVTADNGTALYGYKNNGEIIANYCWLHFKGSTYAVRGIKAYWPSASGIDNTVIYTSGVSFDSSKYGFVDSSSNLVKVNCYPALILNGIAISASSTYTFTNGSDKGIGVTAGTVTYNYSTRTLELKNATMSCNRGSAIVSFLPNLTIKSSTGANTITTNGNYIALDLYRSTSITGDQTLNVTGTTGIYMNYRWDCPLTINLDATFRVTATKYRAIYNSRSTSSPNSDLILKKAGNRSDYFFTASATDQEPIKDVCHLTMEDMDFYTAGCYWDAANYVVKKTGGEVVKGSTVNIYRVNEWYNLWVAGHRLSDVTQGGRFGSPYLTAGTVNYQSSTKTLTLDGVTMNVTVDGVNAIKTTSGAGDITIKAVGDNTLTSVDDAAKLYSNTTFTSSSIAYLRFISNNSMGVSMYGSANATVNMVGFFQAKGAEYGFYGDGNTYPNAVLTLKKASSDELGYNFTGAEGAIRNLGSLELDNMDFWYSTYGCYFDEADKRVEVNGGAVAKGQVVFGSIKEKLPISVCGKQLNRVNGADNPIYVGSKYISSGTQSVGYVPSTKTLTLNNAKIDKGDLGESGIYSNLDGLVINVIGTSEVKSTGGNMSSLNLQKNTTIQGTGTLNLTGELGDLFAAGSGTTVTINDVNINADHDIYGSSSTSPMLAINLTTDSKKVTAKYVYKWSSLTLGENTSIVEPFKAYIDGGTIKSANGGTAQNVVITKVEKYDLAVCDVDVNSYNKDDILRDGGSFKYDPNMKRLIITDADIDDANVTEGIWNKGIEGLNIAINGDNQINVYEDIFKLAKSTTFSGTGTVKGELTSSSGYGIYLAAANVIGNLNGPKFEFTGKRGVGDNDYSNTNLIIEKGCLVFNPNSSSANILKIKNLTLGAGMIIAEPQGGTFSSSLKGITVDGTNLYYGHAVICQKGDVNVDGTVAIADAVAVLNAMAGQEVAGDPDVNGDKEVSIADFVAVLNIMAGQ